MPRLGIANERDQNIRNKALELFLMYPLESVTLDMISAQTGIERTYVHRRYTNREGLYRQVVVQLLNTVSEELIALPKPSPSVRETVIRCGRHFADIFNGVKYQDIVYLMVRDGRHKPWLVEHYQERILNLSCSRFAEVIEQAGRAHNLILGVRNDALRQYFAQLESDIALQAIKPLPARVFISDMPKLIERAAADFSKSLYSVEL